MFVVELLDTTILEAVVALPTVAVNVFETVRFGTVIVFVVPLY